MLTIVSCLFIFLISTFLFSSLIELKKIDSSYGFLFFFFFAILSFLLFIYSLKGVFKHGKKIRISKNIITIGSDTFLINDVKNITANKKFKIKILLQNLEMEGVKIVLKNSKEYIIFDDYYENLWELKNYLNRNLNSVENINHNFDDFYSSINDIYNAKFEQYKGLPFIFTYLGLFALFFFVLGMILLILTDGFFPIIVGILFIIFSIYLFSTFHTFYLSKNYLLIKNFYQLKSKQIYKIDEIQEIVFEQQSRSPITLRVITKKFLSSPYAATSLRKKDWKILKNELEKKNISVRVDSVELWDI
jgi:hypothetical protein